MSDETEVQSVVRLPITETTNGLSDQTIGFFVRLLALADEMTIKGVFVNGHVYTARDLSRQTEDSPELQALEKKGLVKRIGTVYYIADPESYFGAFSVGQKRIQGVLQTAREELTIDQRTELANVLERHLDHPFEDDILKRQILAMYGKFGDVKPRVQAYVSRFRTRAMIDAGSKMSLSKHQKIVSEILQMFEACKFMFKGEEHETDQETLIGAMDVIVQRDLHSLKNHNYLKVMLTGGFKIRQENNGQKRRTDEGYN